jgi:hypothetical protein
VDCDDKQLIPMPTIELADHASVLHGSGAWETHSMWGIYQPLFHCQFKCVGHSLLLAQPQRSIVFPLFS